jgi:hypothetical protein
MMQKGSYVRKRKGGGNRGTGKDESLRFWIPMTRILSLPMESRMEQGCTATLDAAPTVESTSRVCIRLRALSEGCCRLILSNFLDRNKIDHDSRDSTETSRRSPSPPPFNFVKTVLKSVI